jgi:molybdopterin synthase catalytic subunit
VAYAVNQAYVRPEHVLQDGDEVALIPPISGGSGDEPRCAFSLSEAALDPRELERQARTDRDGALATFVGTTRDHNDGLAVRALCYEAYPEMVEKVMARLFAAACERFDVSRIRVAHRLGEVPIGEASVVVVVSAAHRGPAFEACRFVIDRLKEEAPIWKRELLADGNGERWVGELPKGAPSGIDQG